ncbi:hypothetical protein EAO77_26320 [Streptomyces sp. t39]|nr:hypothetical protein EAO77_26320 [Streptomyces sp. t39]
MLIPHDTRTALDAVVDLVNTAPGDGREDGLPDVEALGEFVRRHDVSDVGELGPRDLKALHAVRDRFAEVFAQKRSCTAAISSSRPITPRKIIRGGWESANRQPRGSGVGAGGCPREVSSISGR